VSPNDRLPTLGDVITNPQVGSVGNSRRKSTSANGPADRFRHLLIGLGGRLGAKLNEFVCKHSVKQLRTRHASPVRTPGPRMTSASSCCRPSVARPWPPLNGQPGPRIGHRIAAYRGVTTVRAGCLHAGLRPKTPESPTPGKERPQLLLEDLYSAFQSSGLGRVECHHFPTASAGACGLGSSL
jgi:hypothetical protein